MTIYNRDEAAGYLEIDRWADGFGWFAHPGESARRASHAIRSVDGDGVWLIDPLWAPGIVDAIDDLGPVAGVAVLFGWHARDADRFARHYDVPVSVPAWMDRVEERTDAPVERFDGALGDSGFRIRKWSLAPGWREAIAYREADRTLYVPETVASAPRYAVGDERLGVELSQRLFPPRDILADLDPARVLVGHGAGVLDDEEGPGAAARALEYALAGARRRLPRALATNGPAQFRALLAAMGE